MANTENFTFRDSFGESHTFTNIPTATVSALRKEHGLTHSEAVKVFLVQDNQLDEGELTDAIKAKMEGTVEKKAPAKEKKPKKADEPKRKVIEVLSAAIQDALGLAATVENPERLISFEMDGETYTITLARKRKAK